MIIFDRSQPAQTAPAANRLESTLSLQIPAALGLADTGLPQLPPRQKGPNPQSTGTKWVGWAMKPSVTARGSTLTRTGEAP
jgi:hypothetical protein